MKTDVQTERIIRRSWTDGLTDGQNKQAKKRAETRRRTAYVLAERTAEERTEKWRKNGGELAEKKTGIKSKKKSRRLCVKTNKRKKAVNSASKHSDGRATEDRLL